MKDFKAYLKPTWFLDFDNTRVKEKALEIVQGKKSQKDKAIALFYWTRDQIKYNMYTYIPQFKTNLRASTTLRRGHGFCMSKAVLLSTLARAVDIPARIHMVDIKNHKVPDWVEELMGTKAFYCHGYSEFYIEDEWKKLTPVFDKQTALKAGYTPLVEFDGENDALLSKYDSEGNLFVEYIGDHGIYDDVPIKEIERIFKKEYGPIYTEFKFQRPKRK
jgi:hypothetical protein